MGTTRNDSPTPNTSGEHSPWHKGEEAMQRSACAFERMAKFGPKVVRSYLPDQHREFYSQLPFVVAGTVDEADQPWATIVFAQAGFISTPNDTSMSIAAQLPHDDPAATGVLVGNSIGFLGIDLESRRRNRVNAVVSQMTQEGFDVAVQQTMGNCPKYIQRRSVVSRDEESVADHVQPLPTLDVSLKLDRADLTTISQADTFYVASFADVGVERQVDVSHRGGPVGFVRVEASGELTIPDFKGNLFFNTLGNILQTGKAGLIFVDDESGDMLQMTGSAEVLIDSQEVAEFEGAERLWKFKPAVIVRRRRSLPLRWRLEEMSPHVMGKGSWSSMKHSRK